MSGLSCASTWCKNVKGTVLGGAMGNSRCCCLALCNHPLVPTPILIEQSCFHTFYFFHVLAEFYVSMLVQIRTNIHHTL